MARIHDEIAAKQFFVKRNHSTEKPALPISPNELFRRLKARIGSYREMKRISGVEISTLESWCISAPLDQARTLLRLLSALPERQRSEVMEAGTFLLPRLDHRFLSGDRIVEASLRRIAEKEKGLTIVESESDYLRTFVASALANSAAESGLPVFGYDIHRPDWFIAVKGVEYLSVSENRKRLREAGAIRPTIPQEARLILMNGFWSLFDKSRKGEFLRAAQKYHVLLCDRSRAFDEEIRAGERLHRISVSRNPHLPTGLDDAEQMRIMIEEIE